MLLLSLTAAFLQADAAICALTVEGANVERQGPDRLVLVCPAEHDGLQAAAATILGGMDTELPRQRLAVYRYAEALQFERASDGAWRGSPGQWVIRTDVPVPTRLVERGGRQMICALAIRPDRAGVPEAPEAACVADVASLGARMRANAERAAADWRFLPFPAAYCLDEQIHEQAIALVRGGGFDGEFGDLPDPAALPNLCDRD